MTTSWTSPSKRSKPKEGVVSFTPRNTLSEKRNIKSINIVPADGASDLGDSTGIFDSSVIEIKSDHMIREGDDHSLIIPHTIDASRQGKIMTSDDSQDKQSRQPGGFAGPEFGKASPLRNNLVKKDKWSSIFNIPKAGVSRPEHHRAAQPSSQPQVSNSQSSTFWVPPQVNAPGAFPTTITQQQQQKHDQKQQNSYGKPVHVAIPGNAPQQTTYPPLRPLFSAGGSSGFQPINNVGSRNFVDLTKPSDPDDYFDPDAALRDNNFGAPDPYQYIDPNKATENIKALLEGAFDDDGEDAEGGHRRRLPRRQKKLVEKPKESSKSLADKLRELDVKSEDKPSEEEKETEEDDDAVVDGLNVKLLPHQIEGVSWMVEKEIGKKKRGVNPRGGLLADDMGLGKTIQAISLILMNPRPSDEESKKDKKAKVPLESSPCTLVIAPLALIRQWESELNTKSPSLRILVHHGPSRTKSAFTLKKYDIVITTYQTIMSEHANSSEYDGGVKVGCIGVYWYRIILDEAHSIKNRNAKSTKACYALQSVYRWCMTGTPMQNNLDELQSLIRFLKIKPYNDIQVWHEQITNPMKNGRGNLAMRRLQYFLRACMKRRTKEVLKKDGALVPGSGGESFKIVERNVKTVAAEFSSWERRYYDRLEKRAEGRLEEIMSGAKHDYLGALVLLLRLRQACNHPQLMYGKMEKDKDALSTGTTDKTSTQDKFKGDDKDIDEVADLLGGLTVQTKKCDVCQKILTNEESRSGAVRCGPCDDDLICQEMTGKSHKSSKAMKAKKTKEISDAERQKLRVARQHRAILDSDEEEGAEWVVPDSQHQGKAEDHREDTDDEGQGDWIGGENSQTDEDEKREEDSSDDDSDDDDDSKTNMKWRLSRGPKPDLVASTKITRLLEILDEETPEHKVIVFSQFTSMLDLIEPFLKSEGFSFARYDGSMKNDAREASLNQLRNNLRTRVLLCSLKCGSLGLNLTAASRVVLMEPFWNPFVEEQAIDRVHRLNQTKDVTIYRLTIESSVEERILELQEAKRALAKAALEGGKSAAKLSMQDILALFRRDAETNHEPEAHSLDIGEKVRVLSSGFPSNSNSNGSGGDVDADGFEHADSKRDRLNKKIVNGMARIEHAVYGRRW